VLDHAEVGDRPADVAAQPLVQLVHVVALLARITARLRVAVLDRQNRVLSSGYVAARDSTSTGGSMPTQRPVPVRLFAAMLRATKQIE